MGSVGRVSGLMVGQPGCVHGTGALLCLFISSGCLCLLNLHAMRVQQLTGMWSQVFITTPVSWQVFPGNNNNLLHALVCIKTFKVQSGDWIHMIWLAQGHKISNKYLQSTWAGSITVSVADNALSCDLCVIKWPRPLLSPPSCFMY